MAHSEYEAFLGSKRRVAPTLGREIEPSNINSTLFPFQRDLVQWAVRKGRAALFCDTGLGKTFMQLEWARLMNVKTLIVAPLAVGRQTVDEGQKLGIKVERVRSQSEVGRDSIGTISITNYEMLDHFDAAQFDAVILDESSILKSFTGKIRTKLIEQFASTPYRLCCTATPAPNDISEIANHAEFLGLMTRVEMLAEFFVHDDDGWRLKRHGTENFYRWMASWGLAVKKPSDLGYDDGGYDLPPLNIHPIIVRSDYVPDGQLFHTSLKGVGERAAVRRATIMDRVSEVAKKVEASTEPWICWVGLNDEGRQLSDAIADSVLIEGQMSAEEKEARLAAFLAGSVRVLITKPAISGFGLNLQHCFNMAFVGLGDSYEQYYQCIRRCWRFGQTKPVNAYVVLAEPEEPIYHNVKRKEKDAESMSRSLLENVIEYERQEIGMATHRNREYRSNVESGDSWEMILGDSSEELARLDDDSMHLSVFSPPFATLYTYSDSERDLGTAANYDEFFQHFGYITSELLRVTMPGRLVCVHVQQLPLLKQVTGTIGMRDFRGDVIRHFSGQGFVYHGEVCIDKDPQAQAIRTKSKSLLFVQLRKDSSWMRSAFADYIIVFRKPGENAIPIKPDITNNDWIEWARPIWYGIKESDTLNYRIARDNKDERHIAPLQLGTIERCIRLWSNPGETILSPFAGIGSEGYVAIKTGRRFVGIELKELYHRCAVTNLREVEALMHGGDMFAGMKV